MPIMLCFPALCVCSHAAMTGWICMSTWTCSVCASVWVHCIYKQSAMCVFWSANENMFLTDVAFGTSNVLEQDV